MNTKSPKLVQILTVLASLCMIKAKLFPLFGMEQCLHESIN